MRARLAEIAELLHSPPHPNAAVPDARAGSWDGGGAATVGGGGGGGGGGVAAVMGALSAGERALSMDIGQWLGQHGLTACEAALRAESVETVRSPARVVPTASVVFSRAVALTTTRAGVRSRCWT